MGFPMLVRCRLYIESAPWAPFQYPIRRLIIRSREVSKFKLLHRFEIWQASRQQGCRGACQISERSHSSKYKSSDFKTLRDLIIRRLIGYWWYPQEYSGDKPLSEAIMVRLPTHICVTLPQWVNNGLSSVRPQSITLIKADLLNIEGDISMRFHSKF